MAPKAKTEKELKKWEEALGKKEKALGDLEKTLAAKKDQLKSWEESLTKQNSELEAGIKDLHEREKALGEKEASLKDWEQVLAKAQADLEKPGAAVVVEEKLELSTAEKKLIAEAVDAYGIADEFVFAAGIDKETGHAVIVTNGGAKVKYAEGDEVEPLTQIQITGINPEAEKRKPIAGKKK